MLLPKGVCTVPKTLSDLFLGNIPLCERSIPTGSALQRLSKRLALQEEKLYETLDEDGKAQLDQILNTQLEMDSVTAEENFILGFRLGVRLMVECLSEGSEF